MTPFRVTYDVVTEESAEQGEHAESGYFSRGGWRHDDPSEWTLREVVSQFGRGGFEDGGRSWYTADSDTNYRTGEETSYAVHPPAGITRASYRRVCRVLCGKGGGR